MILAEQIVLLALDPERGTLAPGIASARLRRAAAAALLVELILVQRLLPHAAGVAVADQLPSFHPLLSEALRVLSRSGAPLPAAAALHQVERKIRPLLRRILSNLVDRDILHEQREWLLRRRYPIRSMQALSEVFDSIHAALAGRGDTRSILLLALANAGEVLGARLTAEERARAVLRLGQPITLEHPYVDGHRRSLQAVLDAARSEA
jgi:hypothetical protein